MHPSFKPMLAVSAENPKDLQFPLLASPKLDGVRAVIINGVVMSRSLKPIPNAYVQKLFGRSELNGLDGELICGSPCGKSVFRDTNSAVMSKGGEPNVNFYVFDDATNYLAPFIDRFDSAKARISENCILVPHKTIASAQELDAFEADCLAAGYEGVMLRDQAGEYKFGRSTLIEGLLLKIKRFADSEAEIIDVAELVSDLKENQLGAFRVKDIYSGAVFSIGSGFDDNFRQTAWENSTDFVGKIIKYKFFPSGNKDLPRFPVFLGLRNAIDLG